MFFRTTTTDRTTTPHGESIEFVSCGVVVVIVKCLYRSIFSCHCRKTKSLLNSLKQSNAKSKCKQCSRSLPTFALKHALKESQDSLSQALRNHVFEIVEWDILKQLGSWLVGSEDRKNERIFNTESYLSFFFVCVCVCHLRHLVFETRWI